MDQSNASKPWDRPWTTDELRQNSANWSLAGDAGLLKNLQEFSQKLLARTHATQNSVDKLVEDLNTTSSAISNVNNSFLSLASTQFIENRVQDDDVEVSKPSSSSVGEKPKAESDVDTLSMVREVLQKGMAVLDTMFEPVEVPAESDSEDDESSVSTGRVVLRPINPYTSRPLPYLIGSKEFFEDDRLGLAETPSDEEEEGESGIQGRTTLSSSESGSEVEADIPDRFKRPRKASSSESENSEPESEQSGLLAGLKQKQQQHAGLPDSASLPEAEGVQAAVNTGPSAMLPSNFAAELAAKLGVVPQTTQGAATRDRTTSQQQPKNSGNLFLPPEEEEEDDVLFGKSGKYSGGGGLFDDLDDWKKPVDEEPLWNETESRKSVTEKDTKTKIVTKVEKQSPVNNKLDSLFGTDADEDDIFSSPANLIPPSRTPKPSNQKILSNSVSSSQRPPSAVKTSTPHEKSDGLFDDLWDTSAIEVKPQQNGSKDDDLFAPTNKSTVVKEEVSSDSATQPSVFKKPTGGVSVFGNMSVSASQLASRLPQSLAEQSSNNATSIADRGMVISKSSGISSQDDGSSNTAGVSGGTNAKSSLFEAGALQSSIYAEGNSSSLFSKSEDISRSSPTNPPSMSKSARNKKPLSLFDDEDSDDDFLFSSASSTGSRSRRSVDLLSADKKVQPPQQEAVKVQPVPQVKDEARLPPRLNSSSEDEEDLFAAVPNKVKPSRIPSQTRKSDLFSDSNFESGDIFGDKNSNPPQDDLFGNVQAKTLHSDMFDVDQSKPVNNNLFTDEPPSSLRKGSAETIPPISDKFSPSPTVQLEVSNQNTTLPQSSLFSDSPPTADIFSSHTLDNTKSDGGTVENERSVLKIERETITTAPNTVLNSTIPVAVKKPVISKKPKVAPRKSHISEPLSGDKFATGDKETLKTEVEKLCKDKVDNLPITEQGDNCANTAPHERAADESNTMSNTQSVIISVAELESKSSVKINDSHLKDVKESNEKPSKLKVSANKPEPPKTLNIRKTTEIQHDRSMGEEDTFGESPLGTSENSEITQNKYEHITSDDFAALLKGYSPPEDIADGEIVNRSKSDASLTSVASKSDNVKRSRPKLNIDPLTLLPGAKPPSMTQRLAEKAVGFDQPAADISATLHSAAKERAKIQVKRRPQSRRARQEAIRVSAVVDSENNIEEPHVLESEPLPPALGANVPEVADESAVSNNTPEADNSPDIFSGVPSALSTSIKPSQTTGSSLLSPSTDEEDFFDVPGDLPSDYVEGNDLFSGAPVLSPFDPVPFDRVKDSTEEHLVGDTTVPETDASAKESDFAPFLPARESQQTSSVSAVEPSDVTNAKDVNKTAVDGGGGGVGEDDDDDDLFGSSHKRIIPRNLPELFPTVKKEALNKKRRPIQPSSESPEDLFPPSGDLFSSIEHSKKVTNGSDDLFGSSLGTSDPFQISASSSFTSGLNNTDKEALLQSGAGTVNSRDSALKNTINEQKNSTQDIFSSDKSSASNITDSSAKEISLVLGQDNESLFTATSVEDTGKIQKSGTASREKVTDSLFGDDSPETDDLFSSSLLTSVKRGSVAGKSSSPATVTSTGVTKSSSKSSKSLFGDDDADVDLFSKTSVKANVTSSSGSSIFVSSPDSDDLFGRTSTQNANKSRKSGLASSRTTIKEKEEVFDDPLMALMKP